MKNAIENSSSDSIIKIKYSHKILLTISNAEYLRANMIPSLIKFIASNFKCLEEEFNMAKQKMDGFLTSFMQDLIDKYVDRKSDKTNEIISNGIEEVDNMAQLLFAAV